MSHTSQDDQYVAIFREEAYELLGNLEVRLLELEEHPEDRELVNSIFRVMHTLKGSGAMFGFEELATFTHKLESVFDLVRNGKLQVGSTLIDLTLLARDHIRYLLDHGPGDEETASRVTAGLEKLVASLDMPARPGPKELMAAAGKIPASAKAPPPPPKPVAEVYRIRFRPRRAIFLSGINLLGVLLDIRALGPCLANCSLDQLPSLAECDPEACYASWDMILATTAPRSEIDDVFVFVEDSSDLEIRHILTDDPARPICREKLNAIIKAQPRISPEVVEELLLGRPLRRRTPPARPETPPPAPARILPEQNLCELLRAVDELAVARPLLRVRCAKLPAELGDCLDAVDRIAARLHEASLCMRGMVSTSVISRLNPPGPDLSKAVTGKSNTLKLDQSELKVLARYAFDKLGLALSEEDLPGLSRAIGRLLDEHHCVCYSELHYKITTNRELERIFLQTLTGLHVVVPRAIPSEAIRAAAVVQLASPPDRPRRALVVGTDIWRPALDIVVAFRIARPEAADSDLAVLALDQSSAAVDRADKGTLDAAEAGPLYEDPVTRAFLSNERGAWRLGKAVRRHLVFRQFRLDDPILSLGTWDLILCLQHTCLVSPEGETLGTRYPGLLAPDGLLLTPCELDTPRLRREESPVGGLNRYRPA